MFFSCSFKKGQIGLDMGSTLDKMMEISTKPVLLSRMYFGKHKGKMFRDIPKDYLQWLSATDLDENMRFTVGHYLN